MRAMRLVTVGPFGPGASPLQRADLPLPVPGPTEVRLRVAACGVCHTELDEIEGRVATARLPIVLGHQAVGRVDRLGRRVRRHREGDRVGVGWIHHSSGGADENLSSEFRATGRDVDGGYAEYMTVPADYAYPIPRAFSDVEAAPLLCAGGVGYRALRLAHLRDGEPLGLTGFGASAHLVLQLARYLYPRSPVSVFAREPAQQAFARELGAAWAGDTAARPPEPLAAIIDTTPAWRPALEALRNLRPGGRLVINAIRKEDADRDTLATLSYPEHLWLEKEIKTVANVTQHDIREFLPLAAVVPLKPDVQLYALEDANEALRDLKFGVIRGAKVLVIPGSGFSRDSSEQSRLKPRSPAEV
jgi:propanol-preferring alcohol dehydrogenase